MPEPPPPPRPQPSPVPPPCPDAADLDDDDLDAPSDRERDFDALLGRLLSSAGLLPGLALVWTVFFLVDPLRWRWDEVLGGLGIAVLSWLLYSVATIRSGYATTANSSQYLELTSRLARLSARIDAVCCGEKLASEACRVAIAHRRVIGRELAQPPAAGIAWATGEAYVGLWQRLHGAEEALLDVVPTSTAIAEGQHDQARLTGSTIENSEHLLRTSTLALVNLGPYLATSLRTERPGGSTPTEADARAMLRTVRRAIEQFRDDRSAGLVRLRRKMTQSLVFTGGTAYLILALAIITHKVEQPVILGGCTYYLVGAIVGLLWRARGELEQSRAVEDFGLSTARMLHAPLVSGLAAVGGVMLTALLAPMPLGLDILHANDQAARLLADTFDIQRYPVGLLLAAVFGLTPGLFFDRLRQVGEVLKKDIEKSTAAGDTTGGGR